MKIQVSENVVCRDLQGEAVLLDLATGTYFGLNEVGTRIWHLIRELGTKDGVVTAILEEYETDEERARGDVDSLIEQLRARGLVQVDAEQALETH